MGAENQNEEAVPEATIVDEQVAPTLDVPWISRDPAYRVSKLKAANQPIVSVSPNTPIGEVATKLFMTGYSQLPVVKTPFDLSGVVSWTTIGRRRFLGSEGTEARHFMEPLHEVSLHS